MLPRRALPSPVLTGTNKQSHFENTPSCGHDQRQPGSFEPQSDRRRHQSCHKYSSTSFSPASSRLRVFVQGQCHGSHAKTRRREDEWVYTRSIGARRYSWKKQRLRGKVEHGCSLTSTSACTSRHSCRGSLFYITDVPLTLSPRGRIATSRSRGRWPECPPTD
jgi:hypothetical protein